MVSGSSGTALLAQINVYIAGGGVKAWLGGLQHWIEAGRSDVLGCHAAVGFGFGMMQLVN
ncbi:MAG: hypothetical protein ABL898_02945 [Hyphomicrobiaceae bacterium]|nr:hypothetical protein [Hyphomicrobiaceae bacterium]